MPNRTLSLCLFLAACGVSEDDFEALSLRVDAAESDIGTVQTDLDTTKADVAQLRADHDALAAKVAGLTGGIDLTDIEARLTDAETRLDAHDDTLSDLSLSLTAAADRLDGHDDALAAQASDLGDHESRISAMEDKFGNRSWYTTGACNCTYSSATPADVPSSSLFVTTPHGGALVVGYTVSQVAYGVNMGNTVSLSTRVRLAGVSNPGFSFNSETVTGQSVGSYSPNDTASNQVVIQIPGPGTYQLTLQASGDARLTTWDLWAMQLSPSL